jgi:hypothetical protein
VIISDVGVAILAIGIDSFNYFQQLARQQKQAQTKSVKSLI